MIAKKTSNSCLSRFSTESSSTVIIMQLAAIILMGEEIGGDSGDTSLKARAVSDRRLLVYLHGGLSVVLLANPVSRRRHFAVHVA